MRKIAQFFCPGFLRSLGLSVVFTLLALGTSSCSDIAPPANVTPKTVTMVVTGYCDCGDCCGWERSWLQLGRPVYAYGPNKGKPKEVGITATGTETRHGTAAVDKRYYPYGTIFYIEGYGYARAEDAGGAIKGNHIDLWFSSHDAALQWGRKQVKVLVWPPKK